MVLAIKWIAISSWSYLYCHYCNDDWPKMTFGLRVIRVMVNKQLCIGEECNLICGVWKILLVNVNVNYLCCFNFVGVFEPFFQGWVSILLVSLNLFSGLSFNFVGVFEPFFRAEFQFCLCHWTFFYFKFVYHLNIKSPLWASTRLTKKKWLPTSTYFFLYRIKSIAYRIY